MFEESGYTFLTNSDGVLKMAMPVLNREGVHDKAKRGELLDRYRLSLQHRKMLGQHPQDALKLENLEFITIRDNVHMDSPVARVRYFRERILAGYFLNTLDRKLIEASEVLVGTSRAKFRDDAAKLIEGTPNHPLKFLLRNTGGKLKSAYRKKHHEMIENPDWLEMGHVVSAKSGEAERMVLQFGWINQFDRLTVEGIQGAGAYVENVAVSIGGIGVELRTAVDWVGKKLLTQEVFDKAPQIIF
jgi:hypothetical protein